MAVPPHHFDDDPADPRPGGLLDDLERRQEDVLNQLDDLDAKLSEVLKGLEPGSMERTPIDLDDPGDEAEESPSAEAADLEDFDDLGSAEDWA